MKAGKGNRKESTESRNWVLFDGYCNFCDGSVRFLVRRDRKRVLCYVPLQSDAGKYLQDRWTLPSGAGTVMLIQGNRLYTHSDAALKIAGLLPFPWKGLSAGRVIPRGIRDRIYKWFASHRYRWFGKRSNCRIPEPGEEQFFPSLDEVKRIWEHPD